MMDESVSVDSSVASGGSSAPPVSSVDSSPPPASDPPSPPVSDPVPVSPPEPVTPSEPPAVDVIPAAPPSDSDVDLGDVGEELPPASVDGDPSEDEDPSEDITVTAPAHFWSNYLSPPVQQVSNELELTSVETFQLSPITGANSSGLKKVLLDVIGPYDNIVTQYRYQQNTSSNYTYINEVTPDYPWIASAALFIVLLWSLFALLRRRLL